jgi:ATP-dependent RNA helicase HelY
VAALASCFGFEPRTDQPSQPVWPTEALGDRYDVVSELWTRLCDDERRNRLPTSRQPDPGFAAAAFAWASGKDLDELPAIDRLAAGDFVRVSRQLVDLLKQLRDTFPSMEDDVRAALKMVDRGVVAAQGVG